jgi:hypothetical protein
MKFSTFCLLAIFSLGVNLASNTSALAQGATIDSVTLEPPAVPLAPYCSGLRSSFVEAYFRATAASDTTLFMLEVSDINGNFTGRFAPRFVGTTRFSRNGRDTLNSVRLPDNMQFNPTAATPAYRTRVVSSNGAVSTSSAPIVDYVICPGTRPPNVYCSIERSKRRRFVSGDNLVFTIYRTATTPAFPTGAVFTIQLSDSTANFATPFVLGTVPVNFVGDSMPVSIQIPASIPNGLQYLVRPVIVGNALTTTSTGTNIIIRNAVTTTRNQEIASSSIQLYPNPASGIISVNSNLNAATPYTILSNTGVAVAGGTLLAGQQSLSIAQLPAGVYILQIPTLQGKAVTRFVVR